MKSFENFGQNWGKFDKKCQKNTFCDITRARMKLRVLKFGKCMQKKSTAEF